VNGLSLPTLGGLILTPALIALGQILFKLASRDAGAADAAGLLGLARNPYLLAALVIYGGGTILWIYVLKAVPLNAAYPFMALSFCLVPALAFWLLGEPMSWRGAAGVALIVAGLVVGRG
jgi:drug/metabolite transporter (DMT)-like permease